MTARLLPVPDAVEHFVQCTIAADRVYPAFPGSALCRCYLCGMARVFGDHDIILALVFIAVAADKRHQL